MSWRGDFFKLFYNCGVCYEREGEEVMMCRCIIIINFLSMLLYIDVIGRILECRCFFVCMSEFVVGICGFYEFVGVCCNFVEV